MTPKTATSPEEKRKHGAAARSTRCHGAPLRDRRCRGHRRLALGAGGGCRGHVRRSGRCGPAHDRARPVTTPLVQPSTEVSRSDDRSMGCLATRTSRPLYESGKSNGGSIARSTCPPCRPCRPLHARDGHVKAAVGATSRLPAGPRTLTPLPSPRKTRTTKAARSSSLFCSRMARMIPWGDRRVGELSLGHRPDHAAPRAQLGANHPASTVR